ncbi:MAG: hypothetical protein JST86_17840 [Bacteroidetes bacterium]|nr:hypothetical protein [Bacteroidota bacterium]
MKKFSIYKNGFTGSRRLVTSACALLLFITPLLVHAQADSVAKDAPEKLSPSIEFTATQKTGDSVGFKAVLKAKFKGAFIKLPLMKISFSQTGDSAAKDLGFAITNDDGVATFTSKINPVADKEGKVHFKASFAGNKAMESAEEEASAKRARLSIMLEKADSTLSAKVKLVDLSTGTEQPVKETVVGVYVNRYFSPLKIGEGTTDENGEAVIDVPNNLPGNAKGDITLLAKIDENENYGYLEAAATQKWGTPVSDKIEQQPRALWSSHPPLWMLITFIILMGIVWGHYIVIVVQLFRLRKEEPHNQPA